MMMATVEEALGCNSSLSDYLASDTPEDCLAVTATAIQCLSDNQRGCLCEEGSNNINCEGTTKENEGPADLGAPCAASVAAWQDCLPEE